MNAITSDEVRELLRAVPYPGFARDIVSAGFVKEVIADGSGVLVRFAPNSRNDQKIHEMEHGIREVLARAEIAHVRIDTSLPFSEADMALRKPVTHDDGDLISRRPITPDADSDVLIDRSITGPGVMNPLQAELLEEGVIGEPDVLRNDIHRREHPPGVGLGGPPPEPFEGPTGPPGDTYDGAMPVLQWEIDPHDSAAESVETSVRIDDWEIRVWWQVHRAGELLYASLQAMRDDWADHKGAAREHPVGRSAAVNLVFDRGREAVIAIYGTVRDFRPFVEAFHRAYLAHSSTGEGAGTEEIMS